MVEVTIKNVGKLYTISLEPTDTGLIFKQKIQLVTNIPPERQKILVKGGKVQDDATVDSLPILQKTPIMVLGSPDSGLPSKPVEKQVFLEDLNQNQLYKVDNEPSGFVNVGNTCYANSALQMLYKNDDLRKKVSDFKPSDSLSPIVPQRLTKELSNLFAKMAKKQQNINPTLFLTLVRSYYTQFNERSPQGGYKQQDAEEFYLLMLSVLAQTVNIEDYFKLTLKSTLKCLALPDSEQQILYEEANKLACHITIQTNFLRDGILSGLKETVEKHNDTLGANAEYEVIKRVTRLPKYLTVQFVRFFWKRDTQKKSKILRKVQFPFEFDVADLLDELIKAEKTSVRDKIRQVEKDNSDLLRDFKKTKRAGGVALQQQEDEDKMKLLLIRSKFEDDLKSVLPDIDFEKTTENPLLVYQLQAIISHKGALADSGHYQSWVRDENDPDGERWFKFNDDQVLVVDKEKIEQLAGGGESDNALVLLYKGIGM